MEEGQREQEGGRRGRRGEGLEREERKESPFPVLPVTGFWQDAQRVPREAW